jgi:hypothetical protein
MGVLDDPMVVPGLSLLEKTRIQAQVLMPVMHALPAEFGRRPGEGRLARPVRTW